MFRRLGVHLISLSFADIRMHVRDMYAHPSQGSRLIYLQRHQFQWSMQASPRTAEIWRALLGFGWDIHGSVVRSGPGFTYKDDWRTRASKKGQGINSS